LHVYFPNRARGHEIQLPKATLAGNHLELSKATLARNHLELYRSNTSVLSKLVTTHYSPKTTDVNSTSGRCK
jgi:hypothetical protein